MIGGIVATMMMQATADGEAILASIRLQAESHQPRAACSVTVTTDVDIENGRGRNVESDIVRFDHEAGVWRALDAAQGDDDSPPPRDWYAHALTVAAASETIAEQDDGTFLLSAESLPKGIVANGPRDLGSRSCATAVVSASDNGPIVTQYNISLKEPFRIPLIARGRDYQEAMEFEHVDGYGPAATSRATVWDVSFPGGFSRGRSVFTYSDYDCPEATAAD